VRQKAETQRTQDWYLIVNMELFL